MPSLHAEYVELRGHKQAVLSLAVREVTADPAHVIATGGEDGTVRLWDLRTNKAFCAAIVGEPVNAVSFVPGTEAKHVCASSSKGVLEFDLRDPGTVLHRTALKTLPCGTSEINAVSVHSQGRFVAAADDAGVVHLLERATSRSYKRFRTQHRNLATCVTFRPTRNWEVLSGGQDCHLIRWDFSKGTVLKMYDLGDVSRRGAASGQQMINPPGVNALCATRNGKRVVSGLGDGNLIVTDLDARDGESHVVLTGHSYSVADVALLGEREAILSVGNDRRLNLWEMTAFDASDSDPLVHLDSRRQGISLPNKPNAMAAVGDSVLVADTSSAVLLFSVRG